RVSGNPGLDDEDIRQYLLRFDPENRISVIYAHQSKGNDIKRIDTDETGTPISQHIKFFVGAIVNQRHDKPRKHVQITDSSWSRTKQIGKREEIYKAEIKLASAMIEQN